MVYILLSILLGSITALYLVAPSEYYIILIILPVIGVGFVFALKRYIKRPSKYILVSLPFIILLSYLLTSFITFKPKNMVLSNINTENLSPSKKAVILYADGEMEKYTPYFAGVSIYNKSYFIKPIESYKIKKAYELIEVSKKNMDILKIAKDFNESLLKNGPHYFYLSYSNYTPSLKEAINSALNDGCKDISILNLSNNPDLNTSFIDIKEKLKTSNVNISLSTPILKNLTKEFVLKDIPDDLSKFNGVLILDNNNLGLNIKTELQSMGVNESSIFINHDVNNGLNISSKSLPDDTGNILIINLLDFNNGIFEKYTLPKAKENYENINFQVLNPLKYDKDFLEILVNEYKSIKK